ncbi:putative plant SNARE 12 [Auxenochlorella protothecoides]|uniref:Putative plant SNARE 12 n=1 Tax=Auxenochlorella protothecoides TaxID=3075 RepID=A0A087SRL1_AUXPR|nr:putative plant SNARE 12 [Auxenochlorella protothecoides]KFM28365.1 putative plant SNARE 12 [Auxenochlorella protothecoides]RMZ53693.1 hypothetical protein APUTEX25_003227 [Auxenochlorella protothecoides]|eukprot:RMZ53693.1 hypothetical protein APUTEX25_003227 [Auxenochlorella protothecoides]
MAEVYDQEVQLENLFKTLSDGFKKLDKLPEGSKRQSLLKELTAHMQEAKILIREFEREARLDGLSPEELAARRKQLVQELNGFIGLKKAYAHGHIPGRDELMQVGPSGLPTQDTSTVSDLMVSGRKAIKETDASLLRSERIVNDTVAVGAQTAETLQLQGQQLGKVLDDLDEIHFTMKKARQIMRDMAKSLATDTCITVLFVLVALGIVAVVVLRVLKSKGVIGKKTPPPPPPPGSAALAAAMPGPAWLVGPLAAALAMAMAL